ncbi:MAG: bifunctional 23S rRNA (guanine(2069)-N(7))-methyltransferase RlmK/23S rRNA (guanine(2445)-N(2))-methyltransferase RlmL [Desulfobacteraceae bacterium]|nr:MAG: bifunctional 23S rRNA (guanine(2069)-N(7))-methyltransferase RlmK/23S rRNA (guanine(2445)-N(2))-methyltransferase RlmL [Desulfobacteraceae bacterium]
MLNSLQCKEKLPEAVNRMRQNFTATCSPGLESLLARELQGLGAEEVSWEAGAVKFQGDIETAYRACLWSRFSSRILLTLARFEAPDEGSLYDGARQVPWNLHISPSGTMAVETVSRKTPPYPAHFATLKVKDAVVDHIRDCHGIRPSVRTERPDVRVHLFLDGFSADISLDLSGEGLHRRGYRSRSGRAPLKESLAAAVLRFSGWPDRPGQGGTLLDPMCGSGTFLIEAALMAMDSPPGLGRDYFGFLGWLGHDPNLWSSMLKDAEERRQAAKKGVIPTIVGYDASKQAVKEARENIARAGMENVVFVEQRELAHIRPPFIPSGVAGREGLLVVNPPYGERLGSQLTAKFLYRCLERKLREEFSGWKTGVLSLRSGIAFDPNMESLSRVKLYNGTLPCELRVLRVPASHAKPQNTPLRVSKADSSFQTSFSNRLRKNIKSIQQWAEKESLECYRIYDADIPEYNVAVDVYGQDVRLKEYARPHSVDPSKATRRLEHCVEAVVEVLGIKRQRLHLIAWGDDGKKKRCSNIGWVKSLREAREKDMFFLVDLEAYHECGLPFGQRVIRKFLRDQAGGASFLNLFCRSGAATVCAAMGGCAGSVSVDPLTINVEWSLCNLALNGFSPEVHRVVAARCTDWLKTQKARFDLIFLDMPNPFRNRQIEPVALLNAAVSILSEGGKLICYTGTRIAGFTPGNIKAPYLQEISEAIFPRDLCRSSGDHRCWLISREPLPAFERP